MNEMHNHINIADFSANETVTGYYAMTDYSEKVSKSGAPYKLIELRDRSGAVAGIYVGPGCGVSQDDCGSIVFVEKAVVTEYNNRPQVRICTIRPVSAVDIGCYREDMIVPKALEKPERMMAEVHELLDTIDDLSYSYLAWELIDQNKEAFMTFPAAKSNHHAYIGGLLEHTKDMMWQADALARQYPDLNRDLLLAGAAVHDIGKIYEMKRGPLGLVSGYTDEGMLLGHSVIGAKMVADTALECGIPDEASLLLQHMVLAHHGYAECGAAAEPRIAEADVLHCIDAIDGHMNIYTSAFENTPKGQFSPAVRALNNRQLYNHN